MKSNLTLLILSISVLTIIFACKKTVDSKKSNSVTSNTSTSNTVTSNSIIDGYTDKFSYNIGDSFELFINSKETIYNHQLEITDINGKVVKTLTCNLFTQKKIDSLAYQNGFDYKPTLKSKIPILESGVYLFANKIPFLVKPSVKKDILILYSSNTENAYCSAGGKNMYSYNVITKNHPPIMSFLRPINLPTFSTEFLKWINTQDSYNIGYLCDKDMDDYDNIKDAKLLIIPGHSEYWTRKARRNFDHFINEGNNALILSGNTMWWQVRYNENKNQMICFKNKMYDNEVDSLKTINWPDSILKYPVINSIGADFNYGGYGLKKDKGWDGYKIINPKSPLLESTGLKYGDILKLPTSEYDGIPLEFSKDSNEIKIKNANLFYRSELIGYDFGYRGKATIGTWIIIQPKSSSGVIINTASTDWCSDVGMNGVNSSIVKKITLNMINLLLENDKNKLFITKPVN